MRISYSEVNNMFSKLVLDYKESLGPGSNLINETNNYFNKNYFNNSKPDLKFSPPFIPGEIYFFRYQTNSKISKDRPFINRLPLLLCTDTFKTPQSGTVIKGIDLIVVPPRLRVDIIGKIYDAFKSEIESIAESYKKGSQKNPVQIKDDVLSSLLASTGYGVSVFGFKYNFIRTPGVIKVEDWAKIPYLSSHLVEGSPINTIYKEYQTKLNL